MPQATNVGALAKAKGAAASKGLWKQVSLMALPILFMGLYQ
jgi:hypothetical protein